MGGNREKMKRVNISQFPHSLSISSPFPRSLSISSSFSHSLSIFSQPGCKAATSCATLNPLRTFIIFFILSNYLLISVLSHLILHLKMFLYLIQLSWAWFFVFYVTMCPPSKIRALWLLLYSRNGEDFLTGQLNFFYGNSCNSGTESRKMVFKVGN